MVPRGTELEVERPDEWRGTQTQREPKMVQRSSVDVVKAAIDTLLLMPPTAAAVAAQ